MQSFRAVVFCNLETRFLGCFLERFSALLAAMPRDQLSETHPSEKIASRSGREGRLASFFCLTTMRSALGKSPNLLLGRRSRLLPYGTSSQK